MGDGLNVSSQSQRQQNRRAEHARHLSASAGADVNHRTQGRAGAGKSPDEAGDHVADSLSDQFPVRVVARPGHRVGHQRR